jgi:hypothetical protein
MCQQFLHEITLVAFEFNLDDIKIITSFADVFTDYFITYPLF